MNLIGNFVRISDTDAAPAEFIQQILIS